MTTDETAFLMRELDSIKTTVEKTQEDVVDVRERVTRLEANDELRLKSLSRIQWAIGLSVTALLAGVPVLFLIVDRITN
jgi:hypothetical protein